MLHEKNMKTSCKVAVVAEATEPRGPGGQLTPLFQVRGPHTALDPSLFVVCTCAQSVAVVIHSFIIKIIKIVANR